LQDYLQHPDKSLNPSVVGADNQCELGKWIHGDGKKNANNPKFKELTIEHAKFHTSAAEIIKKADTGQNMSAETTLGAKSEFADRSMKVVTILMQCKKECTL